MAQRLLDLRLCVCLDDSGGIVPFADFPLSHWRLLRRKTVFNQTRAHRLNCLVMDERLFESTLPYGGPPGGFVTCVLLLPPALGGRGGLGRPSAAGPVYPPGCYVFRDMVSIVRTLARLTDAGSVQTVFVLGGRAPLLWTIAIRNRVFLTCVYVTRVSGDRGYADKAPELLRFLGERRRRSTDGGVVGGGGGAVVVKTFWYADEEF